MSEISELLEEFGDEDEDIAPSEIGGMLEVSAMMRPGIYALMRGEEVVYIGKAKLLLNRIYSHHLMMRKKQKGMPMPTSGPYAKGKAIIFSRVKIWTCALSDLDQFERQMIAKYRPKHNKNLRPEGKITFAQIGFDLTHLGIAPPTQPTLLRRRL